MSELIKQLLEAIHNQDQQRHHELLSSVHLVVLNDMG